jgi:hypothetical protein
MRIISNFHDFYDSAMAYGQDQSIIYQRKTIEYDKIDTNTPKVIKELHGKIFPRDYDSWREVLSYRLPSMLRGKSKSFYIESGCVVFCGKVHTYLRVNQSTFGDTIPIPEQFFYGFDSLMKFCEDHKLYLDKEDPWDKKSVKDLLKGFFDKNVSIDYNWLIENKVICADVCNSKLKAVTINPNLGELQFFKVMDAYTAFQNLDMWICGTLSYPQNAMVMLDDKSLIAKHGFDKWSFRKQPEGYGK